MKNKGIGYNYEDHFRRLIGNYSPSLDKEIREILDFIATWKKENDPKYFVWHYTSRLLDFWRAKIRFHFDLVHAQFRDKAPREEIQETIAEINRLIGLARQEINIQYNGAGNCFDACSRYLETFMLESLLNEPLQENEVRFVIQRGYQEYEYEVISLDGKNRELDVEDGKPLPELAKDDFCGQELRAMGMVFSCQEGMVAVGDWYFPFRLTEEGLVGVPVEEILAEFGGCPIPFPISKAGGYPGYDADNKYCSCPWRNFCPGGELISAGSLSVLAQKLLSIWENKGSVIKAIPSFQKKLLQSKNK